VKLLPPHLGPVRFGPSVAGTTSRFLAAVLVSCVCLTTIAVARGAEGRTGLAIPRLSVETESFCAALRSGVNAQRFRFSGWRCRPGPSIRGHETILAWVKLKQFGGGEHVELLWLAKTTPVLDAQVIDVAAVPHYGYEPHDVRRAFQIADM
jgi:hypothetical protein